MQLHVAFRLEANFNVGMGHLYRCQALMNALIKEGHAVSLFVSKKSNKIDQYISKDINIVFTPFFENEEEDAEWIVDNTRKENIDFDYFLVDGYRFSEAWEGKIYDISSFVVVIDDLANRKHMCDYLIDFGFNRVPSDYKYLISDKCKILTGSDYFILRSQFLNIKSKALLKRRGTKSIKDILVSFGATDPKSHTVEIIKSIKSIDKDINIKVITTNLNNNINYLKEYIKKFENVKIYIDVVDVAELILEVDFCVGSLGGSAVERIFLGLPSLCLVTEANQINNAKALSSLKLIRKTEQENINESLSGCLSSGFMEEWHHMSESCFESFDGLGIERLLFNVFDINPYVILLPMNQEHCIKLYEWQCEKGNRKFSRNDCAPSLEEHQLWYENSLKLKTRSMWILVFNGIECGYVRLDCKNNNSEEVSILISQRFRRLGIALSALEELKTKSKYSKLIATVSPDNIASKKLFLGAGFIQLSVDTYVWDGV